MSQGYASGTVTLKLWFGGSFKRGDTELKYVGRSFRTTSVDKDEFCWFTVVEEAEKTLKFNRNVDAIYIMDRSGSVERVFDDIGAMKMLQFALDSRVVECYIVLEGDVAHLMQMVECGEGGSNVKVRKKLTPRRRVGDVREGRSAEVDKGGSHELTPFENPKDSLHKSQKKDAFDCAPNLSHKVTQPIENSSLKTPQKPTSATSSKVVRSSPRLSSKKNTTNIVPVPDLSSSNPPWLESNYDFNELTLSNYFDAYEEQADVAEVQGVEIRISGDDSERSEGDSSYHPSEYSEDDDFDEYVSDGIEKLNDEEDLGFDDNTDDEAVEAREKLKKWNANALKIIKQLEIEASSGCLPGQEAETVVEEVAGPSNDGDVSEYDESGDEEHTPGETEDESRPGKRLKRNLPVVNERTDFAKFKWCVGIKFPNREHFRDCVIRYAIAQGRNLTFDVSNKKRGKRLRVRCLSGCPFKMYASWDNKGASFVVKSVTPTHN